MPHNGCCNMFSNLFSKAAQERYSVRIQLVVSHGVTLQGQERIGDRAIFGSARRPMIDRQWLAEPTVYVRKWISSQQTP